MAVLSQKASNRHFLSISQFNRVEINRFIHKSLFYLDAIKNQKPLQPILKNKTLINCFFEPSTRTQMSFEQAAKKLGANVLNFNPQTSSLKKGESLLDTLKTMNALLPDWISIRHPSPGAAYLASKHLTTRIINAGDGSHEHPSQALLDTITLIDQLKKNKHNITDISQLRILICGDILHSRVVRSQIKLLTLLGAEIHLCAPPTLYPYSVESWGVKIHTNLEHALTQCHVIILLRIQTERMETHFFPSIREYHNFWGLTSEKMKKAKYNPFILHPGPVNTNVEISSELIENWPNNFISQQVTSGLAARMAILDILIHASKED